MYIALCSNNCTTYFNFTIGIIKVDNGCGKSIGILQATSFPVERTQLFQPGLLGPLFAASTYVSLRCSVVSFLLGSAGLRCGRSGHDCNFLCPHRPPILALTSFLEVVTWISFVKILQSLMAVNVARRFGCFTGFTAGRSDAPRCRRHFFTTDLPADISFSS
jgi:hypothetical protein